MQNVYTSVFVERVCGKRQLKNVVLALLKFQHSVSVFTKFSLINGLVVIECISNLLI